MPSYLIQLTILPLVLVSLCFFPPIASSRAQNTILEPVKPVLQNEDSHFFGCNDVNRELYPASPSLHGSDVKELQERLRELNLYLGPLNGIYGPLTQRAVQQFHLRAGLSTGVRVTDATWEALGQGTEVITTPSNKPPQGELKIVIDAEGHNLTLYTGGRPYKSFPIAVGKSDTPSPVGEWKVIEKSSGWGGGFGTRWLGINVPWGIYGIHGTNKPWSIGQSASHGCFRMHNQHVDEVFRWAKVGTPVHVVGKVRLLPGYKRRTIRVGATGPDVVLIQLALKSQGFYWGPADGRYGQLTALAATYYQGLAGLESTGVIDAPTYKALGL